ncbi:accessory factor UbiK family protein [Massilia sp. UMI-21]|nr:accessory factor UbiK family protein [Massilia sp. UMI-21]
MDMNSFFNDIQGKINQAMESGPAKDIERNVKAMMTQGFSKLDLVTREEFDIQAQVLAKTRAKLEALELRVVELEARLAGQASSASTTAPATAASASAASSEPLPGATDPAAPHVIIDKD